MELLHMPWHSRIVNISDPTPTSDSHMGGGGVGNVVQDALIGLGWATCSILALSPPLPELSFYLFIYFFNVYLFLRQRETERDRA